MTVLDAYLTRAHRDLDVDAPCAEANRTIRVMEPHLVAWRALRIVVPEDGLRFAGGSGSRGAPMACNSRA